MPMSCNIEPISPSILNELIDESAKTGEISDKIKRGKHTTRHVELLPINNGWVADTPGFGTMEFIDMNEVDISTEETSGE